MRGDWSAQVHPALRGSSEGREGPPVGRVHGRALPREPALWLPEGVGAAQTRRLEGEQEAGASVVERGGPKGAKEAEKETASSEAGRDERERMREETGRTQRPRCNGVQPSEIVAALSPGPVRPARRGSRIVVCAQELLSPTARPIRADIPRSGLGFSATDKASRNLLLYVFTGCLL